MRWISNYSTPNSWSQFIRDKNIEFSSMNGHVKPSFGLIILTSGFRSDSISPSIMYRFGWFLLPHLENYDYFNFERFVWTQSYFGTTTILSAYIPLSNSMNSWCFVSCTLPQRRVGASIKRLVVCVYNSYVMWILMYPNPLLSGANRF